jgi:hypothetical protein
MRRSELLSSLLIPSKKEHKIKQIDCCVYIYIPYHKREMNSAWREKCGKREPKKSRRLRVIFSFLHSVESLMFHKRAFSISRSRPLYAAD